MCQQLILHYLATSKVKNLMDYQQMYQLLILMNVHYPVIFKTQAHISLYMWPLQLLKEMFQNVNIEEMT
jgi:hypothetical protein